MIRKRFLLVLFVSAFTGGCSETVSWNVGGPYYVEGEKNNAPLVEPGGGSVNRRLVYRKDGKEVVITRSLGDFTSNGPVETTFEERMYGDNLVYIENGNDGQQSLCIFRPEVGSMVLEKEMPYWKLVEGQDGIKLHRFRNDDKDDDSNPVFYSTDFLKAAK